MKNMAFPTTAPVVLTAPRVDDNVTLNTKFTWSNPTKDATTMVLLTGMQEEGGVMFTCTAVDDGASTFPAAAVMALKAKGFTLGQLTMVGRMNSRSYRQSDAQLNLRVMTVEMHSPSR